MDFTEIWHRDPHYRHEMLPRMRSELKRAFPSVPYWDSSNREATISGVYGLGIFPRVFGLGLLYSADAWPVVDSAGRLSSAQVETLRVDRALGSPAVEDLCRQMDIIEREWGTIHGYPNWQGVLNTAFTLRGQELFLDMYDRPQLVQHLLGVIAEVMIRVVRLVEARQRVSGFEVDLLSLSNCVMNMISPEQYRRFVFPHDKRIAESFERFGVHTCEWDVTPYIEVLSELPKMGYLDMGITSDLRKVRARFPATRRAVLYSAARLEQASLLQIRLDMQKIHQELGPCDLVMADVRASTPDQRVNELLAICAELADRSPNEEQRSRETR